MPDPLRCQPTHLQCQRCATSRASATLLPLRGSSSGFLLAQYTCKSITRSTQTYRSTPNPFFIQSGEPFLAPFPPKRARFAQNSHWPHRPAPHGASTPLLRPVTSSPAPPRWRGPKPGSGKGLRARERAASPARPRPASRGVFPSRPTAWSTPRERPACPPSVGRRLGGLVAARRLSARSGALARPSPGPRREAPRGHESREGLTSRTLDPETSRRRTTRAARPRPTALLARPQTQRLRRPTPPPTLSVANR